MPSQTRPREARRGLNISLPQVLLVIALVVGLSVIIDFNRRIQAEKRIVAEAAQLRVEVTALAATESALATEQTFVSSDAYVAQWAHSDGRYVRPGEVLVVPIPANDATSTPAPTVVVVPTPQRNAQIWWDLFFETGP